MSGQKERGRSGTQRRAARHAACAGERACGRRRQQELRGRCAGASGESRRGRRRRQELCCRWCGCQWRPRVHIRCSQGCRDAARAPPPALRPAGTGRRHAYPCCIMRRGSSAPRQKGAASRTGPWMRCSGARGAAARWPPGDPRRCVRSSVGHRAYLLVSCGQVGTASTLSLWRCSWFDACSVACICLRVADATTRRAHTLRCARGWLVSTTPHCSFSC